MLKFYTLREGTRITAVGDSTGVFVTMGSGAVKLNLNLAEAAARAMHTELDRVLPPGAPTTRRPALPSHRNKVPNYRAVIERIRRCATPDDVAAVEFLVNYMGIRTV